MRDKRILSIKNATFATNDTRMENKNIFGTLRLHKETIEQLKQIKREAESKMKKDLLWDEFVELLIEDYTKDE